MTKLRMMDMTAGKLTMPLTFEEYTETYDELGQPVKAWTTLLKAWGKFMHLAGQQKWLAAQVQAEGTITIEVRYIPALVTALRADIKLVQVKADGRTFHIEAFKDPDERRKRLHIDVKEIL